MIIRYELKPDGWYKAWIGGTSFPCGCEDQTKYGQGQSLRSAVGNLVETHLRLFNVEEVQPSEIEKLRYQQEIESERK